MRLFISNITTTAGAKVLLTVQAGVDFDNANHYDFRYCYPQGLQVPQVDKMTGIEQVFIQSGSTGAEMPLWENNGNCFYSGLLHKGLNYRLVYGNNGYPKAVLHFECVNTPRRGFYNPVGNDTVCE